LDHIGALTGHVGPRPHRYADRPTILHVLGIDHQKLTFRHNGIDRRLTDVHCRVIVNILA
jgi:hypothetical protein